MKSNYFKRIPVLLLVFMFSLSFLSQPIYAKNFDEISGYVWLDSNGDGKMDSSEPKISGIDIEITNKGGHVWEEESSEKGYYSYDAFNNGNHIVSVDLAKLQAKGYRLTKLGGDSKINPNTGKSDAIKPENDTMNIGLLKINNDTTLQPTSKLFLNKTVDKNQFAKNEEFMINYTIQPQDIPQSAVPQELYQKNGADISLVIDTSGSMAWDLNGNKYFNQIAVFKESTNGQYAKLSSGNKAVYGLRRKVSKWISQPYWPYWQLTDVDCIYFDEEFDGFYYGYYNDYRIYNDGKGSYIKQGSEKYYIDDSKKYDKSYDTEQSRMDIVKDTAYSFINKFNSNSNINIGLIGYADDAYISYDLSGNSSFSSMKATIKNSDYFKPGGATNIGDGLRKAYWQLSDSSSGRKKYLILLTDGEPTYYSYYDGKYVTDCRDDNYSTYGGGNNDNSGHSTEYANVIARMIAENKDITPFMIAFSKDAVNNKLSGISEIASNGQPGFYKEAVSKDALNDIYDKIAQSIMSDLPIYGLQLQETFPEGIDIVSYSNGLKIDPNNDKRIIGDIGNINYTLDKANKVFKAEPITFWVKLKGSKTGDYVLGKDASGNSTSFVSYKDIDGKQVNPAPSFPSINISIYDNEPPKMDASLTNGTNDYTLSVNINKPSIINVRATKDGPIIATISHIGDATGGKYDFTIPSASITASSESNLYVEAIDKDNRKTVETVPLITLDIAKASVNNNISVKTETNTTINEIKVNNNSIGSDRITDNGQYVFNTDKLLDGDNVIVVTVTNSYNNTSTFTFNKSLNLKSRLVSYGLFGNSGFINNDNKITVVDDLYTKVAFDIKADNINSIIEFAFDGQINAQISRIELYEVNGTDSLIKISSANTPANTNKFIISDFVNANAMKVGKNYALVCYLKVSVDEGKLEEVNKKMTNSILIDGTTNSVNLEIVKKPEVQ